MQPPSYQNFWKLYTAFMYTIYDPRQDLQSLVWEHVRRLAPKVRNGVHEGAGKLDRILPGPGMFMWFAVIQHRDFSRYIHHISLKMRICVAFNFAVPFTFFFPLRFR